MWDDNERNNRRDEEWYLKDNDKVEPVRQNFLGNFDFNWRTCGIIAVIGAALLCIVPLLLFGGLTAYTFGGGEEEGRTEEDPTDFADIIDEDVDIRLGEIVTAGSINDLGCAENFDSTFDEADRIYVVAEDSDFPQGTDVFVRLYHNGDAVEDAPEITADQDYENTCVNFLFVPENGEVFDAGDYDAEFFVNGEESGSVSFVVQ
jgi:hypothetical protein